MNCRCPDNSEVGVGKLSGYRWIITCRGYASVVQSSDDDVWGVVYRISAQDESRLDRWEGISYQKQSLPVIVEEKELSCLVYVDKCTTIGTPKDEYIHRMKLALKDTNLPANYVERYLVPSIG
jgi:gamma-glutamylcyclotransferase (GGCT)/AIG2-like uncharacterized protein YtfP